jgi:hypothetical protein
MKEVGRTGYIIKGEMARDLVKKKMEKYSSRIRCNLFFRPSVAFPRRGWAAVDGCHSCLSNVGVATYCGSFPFHHRLHRGPACAWP